ncbi:Dicer-like protein 1 [Dissostichus eleginoides]|uniref:Dicer-like protein 1 n=1 Tax=Dissostichus eleginoides TaxID=100907 RepID=A0AAD9BCR2_DISEL|nr:Dicer-like protein 1 [Dissostichus eleginoides]
MANLHPSGVPKQINMWQGSWVIVTNGHASLLRRLEQRWEARGTGTPPLGKIVEPGLTPRRIPFTSIILTFGDPSHALPYPNLAYDNVLSGA